LYVFFFDLFISLSYFPRIVFTLISTKATTIK
jgi:hypothetical protein